MPSGRSIVTVTSEPTTEGAADGCEECFMYFSCLRISRVQNRVGQKHKLILLPFPFHSRLLRYWEGELPVISLNFLEKWYSFLYPIALAIFPMVSSVVTSSSVALRMRRLVT